MATLQIWIKDGWVTVETPFSISATYRDLDIIAGEIAECVERRSCGPDGLVQFSITGDSRAEVQARHEQWIRDYEDGVIAEAEKIKAKRRNSET